MKKIKIFIFIITFLWYYNALASNIPIWYLWNNYINNNKTIKVIYKYPAWYMWDNNTLWSDSNIIIYNDKVWYIWNNFNKNLTYTWVLNQTPIWFFGDYKWKKIVFPKLNKIIYNNKKSINKIVIDTGSINNTDNIIQKNDLLKKRIEKAKLDHNIYTYRLREYIKNSDGTFTNIDTLRPYTWDINHLKKKSYITIKKVETNIIKNDTNIISKVDNTTKVNDTNIVKKYNIIQKNDISIVKTEKNTIKTENIKQNNDIITKTNTTNIAKVNNTENISNKEKVIEIKKISKIDIQNQKILDEKTRIDLLKQRIQQAKIYWDIYTYRSREYIKNNDWTFTNISSLNPYTWDANHLKKESDIIKEAELKRLNKEISIKTSNNIIKKDEYSLKTKDLFNEIIYLYWVKESLNMIKNSNFINYNILKSCFLEEKCSDINYFNKIKDDINNSINIEYLSNRLNINLASTKVLNYNDMLKIIFKVFWKEKYFNLNILEKEYSYNINKLLLNTLKNEKLIYTKVTLNSYKRIYFSLLESTSFKTKLNILLFK